jgi:hypothetical protein
LRRADLAIDGVFHGTVLPGVWIRTERRRRNPLPGVLSVLAESGIA